jgi:hypothetical protein
MSSRVIVLGKVTTIRDMLCDINQTFYFIDIDIYIFARYFLETQEVRARKLVFLKNI